MSEHSPEPWTGTAHNVDHVSLHDAEGRYITKSTHYKDSEPFGSVSFPDAQRIVACVNACKGIPTEALDAGVIARLLGIASDAVSGLGSNIDCQHYCSISNGLTEIYEKATA